MSHTAPRTSGLWSLLRRSPTITPPEPIPINIEPFGREHSGKTTLLSCLHRGPLLGAQSSGLELTASDPRQLNQWLREAIERYRDLQDRGLVSTPAAAVLEYTLFEGDMPRVLLRWKDSVGQLLTHATPDAPAEQQKQWNEMIEQLARADVMMALVNCPPQGSPLDLDRFEGELQVQASYLRAALQRRQEHRPAAVALVINKLDAAFESVTEAKTALSDERLRTALARLVRLVEGSTRVGMAAIIPVSALGFGTTVAAPSNGAEPANKASSLLSDGETEWLLRPGAVPAPFGLTALVWWSIMAGILLQPADERREELGRLARLLADDLRAMDAWMVPLECRGAAS
jgi:hypothetical protein